MNELERKLRQARDEMPSWIDRVIHRADINETREHGQFRMVRTEQVTEDEYPYGYEPIGS